VAGLVDQTISAIRRKSLNFAAFLPVLPVSRSVGPCASLHPSISRGQIVDDLADIGIVDRCAIDLDHLGHLGLQKLFLSFIGGCVLT